MKHAWNVSRRILGATAGSLLLLAAVVAVRMLRPVPETSPDSMLTALRDEHAALPSLDPGELAAWRGRQLAAQVAQRWTPELESALRVRLGAQWVLSERSKDGEVSYVVQPRDAQSLVWSELARVIQELENVPGLKVTALGIRTTGSKTARTFAMVEIHLSVQTRAGVAGGTVSPAGNWRDRVLLAPVLRSNANRQAQQYVMRARLGLAQCRDVARIASAGTGHTFPPESVRRDRVRLGPVLPERAAEGRARAAPLRRTSASAEPPAPARPPLRSRPDHPRRARSRDNLSEPQPT